jgi:hypothetical protein
MKKVFVLLFALLMALALVGCNVAPNTPGVTPYAPNGVNYFNGYGGTGNYNNNRNATGTNIISRNMTGANNTNRGATGSRTVPGGKTPYGNRTGTYKNGSSAVRSGVNPADKYILPDYARQP